jgi:N-acetylglucosaminyl-diphospho-decaprenol L-rhamnosyltransferase
VKRLSVVMVTYGNDMSAVADLTRDIRTGVAEAGWDVQVVVAANDGELGVPGADLVLGGQGNVGFAAGNAVALSECSGEWILFINPDARMAPSDVASFVLTGTREPGITVPRIERSTGVLDVWAYADWSFSVTRWLSVARARGFFDGSSSDVLPRYMKAPGAAVLMDRGTARALGPFDPAFFLYGEDRDMTRRARAQAVVLRVARDATLLHPGGESASTVPDLVTKAQLDGALRVAHRRLGNVGVLLAALDLIAVGLGRTLVSGQHTMRPRLWAIRRWFPFREEAAPLREADLVG